jgi:diguanylate cyclase (GGDEF)-like protein
VRWERLNLVSAGLLGLAWGSSVWFVWAENHFLMYLANLLVLAGVSSICMVVMLPVRMALPFFTVGLLLSPLIQLAVVNNPLALQLGVSGLVMFLVQIWSASVLKSELVDDLDSAVRNVALVGLLSQASRELTTSHAVINAKNAALNDAMARLNELVTHDQLTGAYSRRFMFEQLERQASVKLRHGSPVTLIMFDLDHFKTINDRFGHPVGDRALREVVRAVGAQLRDGDLLGRVGGEEFLVLLPMTALLAARQLAERLRETLGETIISAGDYSIALPASFGVAELLDGEGPSTWFQRADAALYQAKALGRNKLVVAD